MLIIYLETEILSNSMFFNVDSFAFQLFVQYFLKKIDYCLFGIPNLSKHEAPGFKVESRGGLL